VRVPLLAVRQVVLILLLVLAGAAARVMPASAAGQDPAPAASFAVSGDLTGVAAVSASNAWAVGDTGSGGTLIAHWDGTAWKRVPSPSPAGSTLFRVAATSARNAWAVGCSGCRGPGVPEPLILRWNGTGWTRVANPGPAGSNLSQAPTRRP